MIIRVENQLPDYAEKTYISSSVNAGGTAFPIKNINSARANWAIQIGETKEERSEILMTSGTNAGSILTTAASRYSHPADTPVYQIKYDTVVFMRSTSGTAGTATALANGTITITPDSKYTIFDDTTAAVTYAYKTKFRSSVSGDESSESDWFTPSGYSFFSRYTLRNRVRSGIKFMEDKVTDDDINGWIDEWGEQMNNAAVKVNKDYSIGTVLVGFGTNGRGTISSTDFRSVRKVEVTYDGVSYRNSNKIEVTDFDSRDRYQNVYPNHYYAGDNIICVKPEQSGGTIRLTYYTLYTPMNSDGDELPVSMRAYTSSFVNYAKSQARYTDEKDGSTFENQALAQKIDFVNEITPRDFTGVQFIELDEPIQGVAYVEYD
jgi:hypothetical protein